MFLWIAFIAGYFLVEKMARVRRHPLGLRDERLVVAGAF
jgi:hypothetical protein